MTYGIWISAHTCCRPQNRTSPGGFQKKAKEVRDFTSTAAVHGGGLVELGDSDEPFWPVDEPPALRQRSRALLDIRIDLLRRILHLG